ncbi:MULTISPECIES: ABC transporter substrate-binding protein [Bacillus]|uniref:Solute-binding protein family 5 domain-containing protein n=2 Tax=Bacillus infantis TaxID=324767 RepID=U5LDP9_9BACI|nr:MULTISPECIES: ABC transporter substrate-binding protein [Bacillus]OXT18279.1 hypothetical protein B9K06_07190 [Bacillus sp. OG2]AGX04816.1 hypothetical protein N288_14580 [Bacillus infantis NRRL B-14911]EAR68097.1 hypothetical protein B14911_25600 [Bacillus sp. NRRL B-14911]MCA1035219.1 ABC transporter substrate-binding protein [Bacillus infantis]MCP1158904.1 ABC transporter substrate-binding protein [Bacillus infantis]
MKSLQTGKKEAAGMIYVADSSPQNWLYILFNTMEEAVRADKEGKVVPNLADYHWHSENVLELRIKEGVKFQNGEKLSALTVQESLHELSRWQAPHPPGTFLNFIPFTLEVKDEYTVLLKFADPDGLAPAKLRAAHLANRRFWDTLGFGYLKLGSGEGHW